MRELQEITFHEIQRHFFAVWEAEQEDPQEVHIADADYDALVLSAFPVREFDAFDRYLLGEEEVNRFIREDEERRRKPVARVLNQCTGAYVHLVRHAEQQQGTIYFSGKNDRSWVFKNVFADESL